MIRNHKQRLIAKPQSLGFHCGSGHLEGLACANNVGKQRVPTVQDSRDRIDLVRTQCDFGVNSREGQVTAVVLARPSRIEPFVVKARQPFSAVGRFPDPIPEGVLDRLLLLLREDCFLLVQDTNLFALGVLHGVEDTNIL